MNVLVTADAVGGVWTHTLDLSRALASHGVEVTLATLGPAPSAEQAEAARSIRGVHLRHVGGKLEWMEDPWDDLRSSGEELLRLAQQQDVDVVHLNGYAHATLDWQAPVLVGAHSCVCGWWRAVHGTPPPDDWARYVETVDAGLRAADLVVAPTAAMLDSLRDHHAMEGVPARVIPNGRPLPDADVPSHKEALVLSVGRAWDEAKGIGTLDRAAEGLPWPVHVAGDPAPPHARDGASPPPRAHVKLLGHVGEAELDAAFARASIYVHPARYEPFGLTPLEAARRGCALVLADLPSLREVWGDGALYAAPGDADALRDAIASLVRSGSLRERMARLARERAAHYTSDAMGRAYLEAYRDLARPTKTAEEESACAS